MIMCLLLRVCCNDNFKAERIYMRIAVIKSGGANFLSVTTALDLLWINYELTDKIQSIQDADGVILPGVGSAGFAMEILHQEGLAEVIRNLKQPVLGICLGMQLLYEFSEEDNVDCLGVIPGKICKFSNKNNLIVPHMGWNNLQVDKDDPILSGIDSSDVYFVHSYYAPINNATLASTEYGVNFTAIAKYNNFYGMQFHPEKSGAAGSKLLENFAQLVR